MTLRKNNRDRSLEDSGNEGSKIRNKGLTPPRFEKKELTLMDKELFCCIIATD
jgi:hypothetical protein